MKILIVDDDKNLNHGISTFLKSNGMETYTAFNGKEGIKLIDKMKVDLILSDIQMPEVDGIELLELIRKKDPDVPIIIMTAFASIETAVEAMQKGADDYLSKPINLKELLVKIEKTYKTLMIKMENEDLKKQISNYRMPEIIGESESINNVKEMLRRISNNSDIPVLIYGKSGTGKELVAKNIHFMSDRCKKDFIPINCAMLSDDLIESELFGHVKGAFTGAVTNKIGLLENSDGGTIFLDEISEMSPRVQSKLLRVIQDGIILPVGSNETKNVNVRFICASNKKLSQLVAENKFRDDLYYRLNVIEIEVPSLVARKKDIPLLIDHFLKKYNEGDRCVSSELLITLEKYIWPGNIRELENLIRMILVTNPNKNIEVDDLPQKFRENKVLNYFEANQYPIDFKDAYNQAIIEFESTFIKQHLSINNYNISKTSESINLSRVSLHKKIKEYSISLK